MLIPCCNGQLNSIACTATAEAEAACTAFNADLESLRRQRLGVAADLKWGELRQLVMQQELTLLKVRAVCWSLAAGKFAVHNSGIRHYSAESVAGNTCL